MATGGVPIGSPLQLLRELSRHSSESESGMCLSEEIELLQNVYFDDLQVVSDENSSLLFHITPSTCDDKDTQFVYCDLTFIIDNKNYPGVSPNIAVTKSRGLSDAHIESIVEGLSHLSFKNLGSPMIYDLVEYVRDCLTDNNRPCGRCPICQYDFQDDDQFVRTECYHYFHPNCLSRYVDLHLESLAKQKEESSKLKYRLPFTETLAQKLECPVCRVAINSKDHCLLAIKDIDATELENNTLYDYSYHKDPKLMAWQEEMALLFEKQQRKGGIIDLLAQDAVIDGEWVSSTASESQQNESSLVDPDDSLLKSAHDDSKSKSLNHHSNERKGRFKGERYVHGNKGGKQHREGRGREGGRQQKYGEGQWEERTGSGETGSGGRHNHWKRREDRKWKKEGETFGTGRTENKDLSQDIVVHDLLEKESKAQDGQEGQQEGKTRSRRKDRRWDHQRKDGPSMKSEGEKPDERKTIIKRQAPDRDSKSCDKHGEHREPQKEGSISTNKAETQTVVSVESNRHRGDQRWKGGYEGRQNRRNYRQDFYSARRQGSTNAGGQSNHQETDKSGEQKEEVMKLKQEHKEEPRSNKIEEDNNS
ncbi:PREDICTED: uncharacterized protein LOC105316566 [Amphimedon queenslandica]|uniref:RWD domain-containing protein n=1 Tax=Amphimedon queenslandica TaxID=400682 RepID=A0A1X7VLS7_AMPQE|nr:PREDICTED: uncharacterized protein LOC105316566 [Amphimedon queenslandica]|eukprot:XP_019864259.1 PREDICTED: uncharacterized protein LOC105316566 [Amphimedon queenslandica]